MSKQQIEDEIFRVRRQLSDLHETRLKAVGAGAHAESNRLQLKLAEKLEELSNLEKLR